MTENFWKKRLDDMSQRIDDLEKRFDFWMKDFVVHEKGLHERIDDLEQQLVRRVMTRVHELLDGDLTVPKKHRESLNKYRTGTT